MKHIILILLVFLSVKMHSQATIDTIHIRGTRQYLGQSNKAILEIKFSNDNTDKLFHKPLIVVEGYDFGLGGIENEFGANDLPSFLIEANNGESQLPYQLNTYDIIYINFKSGQDYLQRNSYLVEDVIKYVNSVKVGTAKNVVLGQSMGGLLARYALRDMEKQAVANPSVPAWKHQTSLYISHDAPHQGANIPLAIQAFARHLINQFVDTPLGDFNINMSGTGGQVTISDIETVLNQPGTKQLLANYMASNFTIDNGVGDAWRTELRNLGYPLQTRNIAISNGSHCANPQEFKPSDNLFSFKGSGQTKLLVDLLQYIFPSFNAIGSVRLADAFNEPGLLIGILPGNSKFELNFYGSALPVAGARTQIYHGSVSFTKTLFKLFGWTPRITVSLTNRNYDAPGILSYDYYPGGKSTSFIQNGDSSESNILLSYGFQINVRNNFNFIPTPSALDVGKGNVTLNNADYFVKYNKSTPPTGSRAIPFDNFITSHNNSGTNENHISFNTLNGNWLAKEIDADPNNSSNFDCRFMCANDTYSGPDIICTTATFTAPVSIPATYFDWYISSGSNLATITSGLYTNTITITANPNVSGYITLYLIVGNYVCGNKPIYKTIWVGPPSLANNEVAGYNWVARGTGSSVSVGKDDSATSYLWSLEVDPGNVPNCGTFPNRYARFAATGGPTANVTTPVTYRTTTPTVNINWGLCTGSYIVNCSAVNECGMTPSTGLSVTVGNITDSPCASPITPTIPKTNPNPVKDGQIEVVLDYSNGSFCNLSPASVTTQTVPQNQVLAKIYDMLGNNVFTKYYESNEVNLNAEGTQLSFTISGLTLKPDNYILHVTANGKISRSIIIIQ